MRIAIVNDLKMAVEALRRVISTVPEYRIAWIAYDGSEAVLKCAADPPDLILMDLIMPVMDGVEATRRIMQDSPCAILVVTATVTGNASKVFDAMAHGALDAVNTPVLGATGATEGAVPLLSKMATIAKLLGKSPPSRRVQEGYAAAPPLVDRANPLLIIGASTGGPLIIGKILSRLPSNLAAGIVIIQHIDVEFAPGLADWLNEQSKIPVQIATNMDQPEPGKALIAATNDHLAFTPAGTLRYTVEPRELAYRPSVDVFFRSVVSHWRGKGVAVLLTGMGRDGAEGMLELRRAGWWTIAQDKESSIVYGMPKAAAELDAASQILPGDDIAPAILQAFHADSKESVK